MWHCRDVNNDGDALNESPLTMCIIPNVICSLQIPIGPFLNLQYSQPPLQMTMHIRWGRTWIQSFFSFLSSGVYLDVGASISRSLISISQHHLLTHLLVLADEITVSCFLFYFYQKQCIATRNELRCSFASNLIVVNNPSLDLVQRGVYMHLCAGTRTSNKAYPISNLECKSVEVEIESDAYLLFGFSLGAFWIDFDVHKFWSRAKRLHTASSSLCQHNFKNSQRKHERNENLVKLQRNYFGHFLHSLPVFSMALRSHMM